MYFGTGFSTTQSRGDDRIFRSGFGTDEPVDKTSGLLPSDQNWPLKVVSRLPTGFSRNHRPRTVNDSKTEIRRVIRENRFYRLSYGVSISVGSAHSASVLLDSNFFVFYRILNLKIVGFFQLSRFQRENFVGTPRTNSARKAGN